jgi:hypothetical protein
MRGDQLRATRILARIPGFMLSQRARISRSRLSDIERGYVEPSEVEISRVEQALQELIQARQRMAATASECGWPVSGL